MTPKTDISPEAVERLADRASIYVFEMGGVEVNLGATLRAQAARIAELEAALDNADGDDAALWRFWSNKSFDLVNKLAESRAEALREAAEVAEGWFGTPDADDISRILHGEILALIEKEG